MALPLASGQHLKDGCRTGVPTDLYANQPGVLNHGYRAYQIRPEKANPIAIALAQDVTGGTDFILNGAQLTADVPRTVSVTLLAALNFNFDVAVFGVDDLGRHVAEIIPCIQQIKTFKGKKAFKTIDHVGIPSPLVTVIPNVSLGWSNVFGLPYFIYDEGAVIPRFNQPRLAPVFNPSHYESGYVQLKDGRAVVPVKSGPITAAQVNYWGDGATLLDNTGTLSISFTPTSLSIFSTNANDQNFVSYLIDNDGSSSTNNTLINGALDNIPYRTGDIVVLTYLEPLPSLFDKDGILYYHTVSATTYNARSTNANDDNKFSSFSFSTDGGPLQIATLVAGEVTVSTSLAVPGASIGLTYYSDNLANPLLNAGTLVFNIAPGGNSFTISSSNLDDINKVAWVIDGQDGDPINYNGWFPLIVPGATTTPTFLSGDTRGTVEIPDLDGFPAVPTDPIPDLGSLVDGIRYFFFHMELYGTEQYDRSEDNLMGLPPYGW